MSAYDFESLLPHVGHEISVHTYDHKGDIYNVTCACEDCQEVLVEYDNPEFSDEEDNNEEESIRELIEHSQKLFESYRSAVCDVELFAKNNGVSMVVKGSKELFLEHDEILKKYGTE